MFQLWCPCTNFPSSQIPIFLITVTLPNPLPMALPLTMEWAAWEQHLASPDTEPSASSGALHSMLGAVDKRVSEEVRSCGTAGEAPSVHSPMGGHRHLYGSASGHPCPLPSQGMKVSCTHFQCAAGAFAYLREHFPHAYSVDMSRQILTLNVNLMLVRQCPSWQADSTPGGGVLVGLDLGPGARNWQ